MAVSLMFCGCHQYPNVFLDDLPPSSAVTTASARQAAAADRATEPRVREFEPMRVEPQAGTVVHQPLWMEDPTEMSGSEDGQFAATAEDLICLPYSVGRFFVNALLMPISMAVDPPDATVCSDGVERLSRVSWLPEPYDADRCNGVAMPIDVHEVWMAGEEALMELPIPVDEPVDPAEPAE